MCREKGCNNPTKIGNKHSRIIHYTMYVKEILRLYEPSLLIGGNNAKV